MEHDVYEYLGISLRIDAQALGTEPFVLFYRNFFFDRDGSRFCGRSLDDVHFGHFT